MRVPAASKGLCVIGEALIDFLPREASSGEPCYVPKAGGSPFNVCIAARRLGLGVHFFGGLSTDLFGEDLFAQLAREGVDLSLVRRVARPSTLAFVSTAPGADIKYAFFKENSADRCLTAKDAAALCEGRSFGAVHVSLGAVTLEDAQMREAFYAAFAEARASGALTSFDPNVRASMIGGPPADYRRMVEEFIGAVDVAKASDADLEYLYGSETPLATIAEMWLGLGARLVVVTRGAEGATAYYAPAPSTLGSVCAAPPTQPPKTINALGEPVPVADTVGAGDTLTGALLHGLLGCDGGAALTQQLVAQSPWHGEAVARLKEILVSAVTAAAINVSRAGCDPPTATELSSARSMIA